MDTYSKIDHDELQVKQIRHAYRVAEDEIRRTQPCACCQQPIGPTADYVRHLEGLTEDESQHYLHAECRRCEICDEVIAGEYVEIDVKQLLAPAIVHHVHVYSAPHYLTRVYYHATCAYHAGITPTNRGKAHPNYGFATRTANDRIKVEFE